MHVNQWSSYLGKTCDICLPYPPHRITERQAHKTEERTKLHCGSDHVSLSFCLVLEKVVTPISLKRPQLRVFIQKKNVLTVFQPVLTSVSKRRGHCGHRPHKQMTVKDAKCAITCFLWSQNLWYKNCTIVGHCFIPYDGLFIDFFVTYLIFSQIFVVHLFTLQS